MNGTTNQPNLLDLAKQGNAKAIAALINRQLQTKGITVEAALKDDCLQVTAESAQVPNQQAFVEFIRKGLTNISPKSIKRVEVHGKRINTDCPLWSIEFEIGTGGNSTNALDKTEEKTGSSLSESKTTENSKGKPHLKSFVLESTGNKQLDIILKKTALVLISAILIVSGWRIGQATGFLSSDTASAPSTTTAYASASKPAPAKGNSGKVGSELCLNNFNRLMQGDAEASLNKDTKTFSVNLTSKYDAATQEEFEIITQKIADGVFGTCSDYFIQTVEVNNSSYKGAKQRQL